MFCGSNGYMYCIINNLSCRVIFLIITKVYEKPGHLPVLLMEEEPSLMKPGEEETSSITLNV